MRTRRAQIPDAVNNVKSTVTVKYALTVKEPLGPSTKQHHFIINTSCTGHFLAITAHTKTKRKQNKGSVSIYQTMTS